MRAILARLTQTNSQVLPHPVDGKSEVKFVGSHGEISKENASFKKVNDSLMDFTRNGYQWFQVAELAYDSFMLVG